MPPGERNARFYVSRLSRWYRGRRLARRYLSALARELLERGVSPEEAEAVAAARLDGVYRGLVRALTERIDLVLEQLDRKLEGTGERQGARIRALEEDVAGLRRATEELRAAVERGMVGGPPSRAG